MNITFMIGNGFDLGLGMKSSFKDFFAEYHKNSANKDESIKQLSEHISADEDTWSYFEKQLGEYTVEFDCDTVKNLYAQIKDFTDELLI